MASLEDLSTDVLASCVVPRVGDPWIAVTSKAVGRKFRALAACRLSGYGSRLSPWKAFRECAGDPGADVLVRHPAESARLEDTATDPDGVVRRVEFAIAGAGLVRQAVAPWGPETFERAAGNGRADVPTWLSARGWELRAKTATAEAAASGRLSALRWLDVEGCEWDETAAVRAAGGGHLRVLRWLRAEGRPCPLDRVSAVATTSGNRHVVAWARTWASPSARWRVAGAAVAATRATERRAPGGRASVRRAGQASP